MEIEEGDSTIHYVIDRNSFGKLTETTTPVWRHQCGDHPEEFHHGLNIHHDNYLRCFYYDKEKNCIFYETYDSKWETRIHNQDFFDKYCLSVNNVPTIDSIYLKLEFREILRSMIRFLVYLHKSHYSLMRFAEENIVFKDNKLKFVAVRFRVSSEKTRREDFDCIYEIVTHMFKGNLSTSKELDDWIHLLKFLDFTRDDCGLILLYHLAVIPPTESLDFFVSCSERLTRVDLNDFSEFMNAITGMPLLNNWHKIFTPGTVSHRCFDFGKEFYKTTTNYNPITRKKFTAQEVKLSLLRCCRNLAVHVQEHSDLRLSDLHIERKIMNLFGRYLLTLQIKLYERKCLLAFVNTNQM
ncbi:hypothetical protein ABFS83_07G109200 [Erythranthe nasuta]